MDAREAAEIGANENNGADLDKRIFCARCMGILPCWALVEWAADREGTPIEDVGVDHSGADVVMAEELLDGANVVTRLEQVGREAVTKAVAGCALGDAGFEQSGVERSLHHGFVEVVAPQLAGVAVTVVPRGREYPLPRPRFGRAWELSCQRVRKGDAARTDREVRAVQGLHELQVGRYWSTQIDRQQRYAVFSSFASPN